MKNSNNITGKSGIFYNLLDLPFIYQTVQFLLRKFNTNSRIFSEFFVFDENAVVLDCGCGPGNYRRYIKSREYIGIDINEKHIAKAKRNYPDDRFVTQDLTKFDSEMIKNIDVVLMIGILHHLPDDICRNIFEDFYKKLSTDGKVYCIDPVFIQNQRKVAKFLARRDKGNFVRTSESYKNLVGPMFKVESFVVSNLLRVPYDHYVMKILK